MPIHDAKVRRATLARHGAVVYPRPDQTPKRVHHGPSVVTDFAVRQRCGEPAAKKRLETFRLTLADLVDVCRTNPVHREWLQRTLAEAVAVCAEPVGTDASNPIEAYADADSRTEPAMARWLLDRCPGSFRAFLAALRRERAANADLELALLRECAGGIR